MSYYPPLKLDPEIYDRVWCEAHLDISAEALARQLGVDGNTVRDHFDRLGVPRRRIHRSRTPNLTCDACCPLQSTACDHNGSADLPCQQPWANELGDVLAREQAEARV